MRSFILIALTISGSLLPGLLRADSIIVSSAKGNSAIISAGGTVVDPEEEAPAKTLYLNQFPKDLTASVSPMPASGWEFVETIPKPPRMQFTTVKAGGSLTVTAKFRTQAKFADGTPHDTDAVVGTITVPTVTLLYFKVTPLIKNTSLVPTDSTNTLYEYNIEVKMEGKVRVRPRNISLGLRISQYLSGGHYRGNVKWLSAPTGEDKGSSLGSQTDIGGGVYIVELDDSPFIGPYPLSYFKNTLAPFQTRVTANNYLLFNVGGSPEETLSKGGWQWIGGLNPDGNPFGEVNTTDGGASDETPRNPPEPAPATP